MGRLDSLQRALSSVGWFIPPYVQLGFLFDLAKQVSESGGEFSPEQLEAFLGSLYGPDHVGAMVTERYPLAPVIREYRVTIAEAAEAHFMGLHHVAVGGLVPVIEGAGYGIASTRGVRGNTPVNLFRALARDCRAEVRSKGLGAVEEVTCMLDSFAAFTSDYLYKDSRQYSLTDGTNRPGITHGRYTDAQYGRPLNFFKTIAAVDFLTFVVSFRANLSWFPPEGTTASNRLASYYRTLSGLRTRKPSIP